MDRGPTTAPAHAAATLRGPTAESAAGAAQAGRNTQTCGWPYAASVQNGSESASGSRFMQVFMPKGSLFRKPGFFALLVCPACWWGQRSAGARGLPTATAAGNANDAATPSRATAGLPTTSKRASSYTPRSSLSTQGKAPSSAS